MLSLSCIPARLASSAQPDSHRKIVIPPVPRVRVVESSARRGTLKCSRRVDGKTTSCVSNSKELLVARRTLNLAFVSTGAAALLSSNGLSPSEAALAAGDNNSSQKMTNLPIEELKEIIAKDIGDRQYFITGDLTRSIYREDCRFKDPTNLTIGVDKYLAALTILFEPEHSKQELIDISTTSQDGQRPAVIATWRLGGYLKFPWQPRVVPFTGSTRYEFDEAGLVALHQETWSISPFTALLETLTPTFGPKQML